MVLSIKAEKIEAKIREDEKNGFFKNHASANVRDIAHLAYQLNRISQEDYTLLQESNRLRDIVIHVDNFPTDLRDPRAFLDVQQ